MKNELVIANDKNWDFPRENTREVTHGLHPYPARMVPKIAYQLMEMYSEPSDLVYDPFCGSGTTLVEASILGRHSIGVDLNPFAVLLSQVKTTAIEPQLLHSEWQSFKKRLIKSKVKQRQKNSMEFNNLFLNLEYWYKPYVIRDLTYLRTRLMEYYPDSSDPIGNFFKLMFAKTCRDVSNNRPSELKRWRIPNEELALFRPKPINQFINNIEKAYPLMVDYYNQRDFNSLSRVIQCDAREFKLQRRASLIITSPPYGDSGTTVAYGQFSSFAIEWLGLDSIFPKDIDREPLGPTDREVSDVQNFKTIIKYHDEIKLKNYKRAKQMVSFYIGMNNSLKNMRKSIKKNKYCCVIVGNRRISGIIVPMNKIICEIAEEYSFNFHEAFKRKILKKNMPFSTKSLVTDSNLTVQPTMSEETILIFKSV